MGDAMSMKTRVVVNPASANGKTGKRWSHLATALRRKLGDFDAVFTESQGHGKALTEEAIASGVRHVVSVGGDGTHNEVVNGCFLDGQARADDLVLSVSLPGRAAIYVGLWDCQTPLLKPSISSVTISAPSMLVVSTVLV